MTLMLTSVSSVAEAEIVLAGGADVIDCKDASRGALGALPLAEIAAIVAAVAGRRPVSAVVELSHDPEPARRAIEEAAALGVAFVKFALPATPDAEALIEALAPLAQRVRLVAVLFADLGPDLELLPRLARAGFAGALLDTAHKGKGRLLEHFDIGALSSFVERCHALGLEAGLAGSLEAPDVPRLLVTGVEVIGFRGALCAGHDRRSAIDAQAVALIRDLIPGDVIAGDVPRVPSAASRAETKSPRPAANVDWSLVVGRGFLESRERSREIDHIFVRDLVIPVEIGAYDFERGRTQRVRFNVDVDVTRVSVSGDDMRNVFSYDVIMDAIKMILASGHIELVETIAERLAELVLRHERVQGVNVQVEKLDVAPGAVGVRIRRERQAETAKVHHLFPGLPDAAEPKS
ncbi:MAG TPA: (5-formylfuran-3-yl)methyl phosphate synthase [Methylosinus sp.]|jgi:dihydroneopterin aldolase|uniref:(5-formylfuran-3-yl)methyl phosphate synthase n=1 Tax=Methylosinus sp. TaxID=427 RepID=UPI002F9269E3